MLIGHWPLNGNTNDYSGYGRTLSLNGGSVEANGKIGSCYLFNAANEYASVSAVNNDFQSIFNGNFTISF